MLTDLRLGHLIEPISGRVWSGREMREHCGRRSACYADLGLRRYDRVFLHHGNSLEFFADLLAIWNLGACAIPLDPRLTPFEVETLAAAAKPRFSIWNELPHDRQPPLADVGAKVEIK